MSHVYVTPVLCACHMCTSHLCFLHVTCVRHTLPAHTYVRMVSWLPGVTENKLATNNCYSTYIPPSTTVFHRCNGGCVGQRFNQPHWLTDSSSILHHHGTDCKYHASLIQGPCIYHGELVGAAAMCFCGIHRGAIIMSGGTEADLSPIVV